MKKKFYIQISAGLLILAGILLANKYPKTNSFELASVVLTGRKTVCSPYDNISASHKSNCKQRNRMADPIELTFAKDDLLTQRQLRLSVQEFLGAQSFNEAFPDLKSAPKVSQFDSVFWNNFVSETLAQIFKIKTLRNAESLCKIMPSTLEQFSLQFGFFDRKKAEDTHQNCLKINPNAVKSYFGNQVATKEYFFVQTPPGFVFTGWTDQANTTYLFVNEKTTWGDLVLAIVHEIAIGMDSKLNQGIFQFKEQWPLLLEQDSIAYEEWTNLFEAALLPEISYAFATLRANKIMFAAQNEVINQKNEAPSSDLREDFRHLLNQASHWKNQSPITESPMNIHNQIILDYVRKKFPDLSEAANLILNSNKKIRLTETGPAVDFFTYMSTPTLGKKSSDTIKANGPGCGYCSGSHRDDSKANWDLLWQSQLKNLLEEQVYDNE